MLKVKEEEEEKEKKIKANNNILAVGNILLPINWQFANATICSAIATSCLVTNDTFMAVENMYVYDRENQVFGLALSTLQSKAVFHKNFCTATVLDYKKFIVKY